MLIKWFFRFILFAVVCFCIFGISNAKTSSKPAKSENDNGVKRKISRAHKTSAVKTLKQTTTDKSVKKEMPEIVVKEDTLKRSSFLLPSPLKEEKAFKPIERRKAIRNKANEVYSKEKVADKKTKDINHSISYLPDRARASITRSMHQIVVEKEKGLKPKIEYKSVKYTMMPEEGGNDIQTSLNKKDPLIKEKDFSNSVSKFLIKRKYIIGSLAGMAADNKAVQYILDGQTVFNDKYLTSTADPIAFKQKSDQKSMNKLEEVRLIKSKTKKKKSDKRLKTFEKKSKTRKTVKTKSKKKNRDRYDADMNTLSEGKIFTESPVTKYDKMPMLNKLKYLRQVNKGNSKTQVKNENKIKTKTNKRKEKKKEMSDVFVTRRKSIRPHQNELKQNEKQLTQTVPLHIEIDTKDWKTNYRRKKDKLLKSILDSTIKVDKDFKKKVIKSKTIKEVIQQKTIHSFRIKPNTTIEVGNTEFTVGIPPNVPIRPRRKEKAKIKSKNTPPKKKSLKPPATLKAFRSDELREVVDTATVSNEAKTQIKKEKIPKPSKVTVKPKAPSKSKLPPAITKHFPLKIEFVTAKLPTKSKIKKNETRITEASRKKFITNGLVDDPKNVKSRIITSSENLNVNLDHYASEFTRTGITNGENNIVVGTLSGISDRANAGMLNLQVDTVKREKNPDAMKNKEAQKIRQLLPKVPERTSNVKANVDRVKKHGSSQTDFSISLLAAHEVESTTRAAKIQRKKPTKKAPVKKSPRFVLRNNQSSGKNFVFSFKTNKKPKVKIPEVPSVSFQPAFIYKDTAEIHRSENSLYTNSIHEKSDKKQFYKHNIMRDKQTDFRWPMPSPTDPIQGIPVTQPPPEVSTLGMIISGDFVSSFAEQAFKDVSYSSNTKKIPKSTVNLKLGSSKLVKNDFIFPDQSLFTPAPKAISTMDKASAAKRRNGLYSTNNIYSSDIQKEIEALLNSTETVQLTDIPGNIDIRTSTVPLPQTQETFLPKMPSNLPFVYRAETQAGETKMQKLNTKPKIRKKIRNVEPTTSVNSMAAGITGYDIGLSLKKEKLKKSPVQIIQAKKAFEETSQNPIQNIYAETKPRANLRGMKRPSVPMETVILPTVSTTKQVVTEKTTTSTGPTTEIPTTTSPTTTTTTQQAVVSKLTNLNLISEKAKDTLQKINEVFKGAPEGIVAISKTDAFKKYREAAKEVIELDKTPTMVPAVGIIKPLRKSEAIYKFSRYGNQRNQGIVEDNAIKREIKKLLIQQNTIYPAPVQNGMVSYQRVTPMMNQNIYSKNDITSNSRGILYNTPEMTSMIMATESVLPQQNNAYIQNYNFPGANRQVFASSARYPSYQQSVRATPPTPLNPQLNVYQPSMPVDSSLRLFWTTVLPSGGTMDEFAIVKDDEMVIYVVSDQVPLHGRLDKSSTLLDFTVGHMAMRFDIDGTNGQICFVTHTSAKFQKTKEALQRRAMAQVVTLADPIQLYAELTTHVPHHNLHTVGGAQFYKFCKAAIKQDNVYELVMEPTGNVGTTSFTGSGLVYPTEPGLSVPITINVESMINLKNKRF